VAVRRSCIESGAATIRVSSVSILAMIQQRSDHIDMPILRRYLQ
jgi:hypothetical protein